MYEEKKSGNGLIIAIIAILIVIMIGAVAVVLVITMGGFGGKNVEKLVTKGQEYLKNEEYDEAIDQFEEAREIDPTYIAIYKGLSDAYIGLEDYEGAIEVLDEAMKVYEDEDDDDGQKKIRKLMDKVLKEAEKHGVTITDSAAATEEAAAEEGDDTSDGASDGGAQITPGTDIEEPPATETVDPSENEGALEEYYNSLVSRTGSLPYGETFELACKYVAASGERMAYVGMNSDVMGYINHIFYDFDMDGINELVMTYFDRTDTITVEVVDIVGGSTETIFSYSGIEAYLGGFDPTLYPQLATEAASFKIGLCEKDGKMFIVSRNDCQATIFDTKVMADMHIYEVQGNTATEVFEDYLIGKTQSEFKNDAVMMDAYSSFPEKLRALGFYDTADNLDFNMDFAQSEGITPLVFGCSRHSCMYDASFNASSLKKNKSNGNPGVRVFVFAEEKSEGYSIIDSKYPVR